MEESRRQQKVASLLQQEMAEMFTKQGSNWYGQAFVTISGVKVTPDLGVARFYLSIFNKEEPQAIVDMVASHTYDIRYRLGKKIRHQLRTIPEIEFYLDSSLDNVDRISELLDEKSEEAKDQAPDADDSE
ncbi:MAG: ribosome-binding factor A [Limisphaerales bacterium]|jgi:ribosome-binding factor A